MAVQALRLLALAGYPYEAVEAAHSIGWIYLTEWLRTLKSDVPSLSTIGSG